MRYDFGKVYKEIRKSKNLTQSDVCGNVLSPTTLSKIENGLVVPKYENMAFLLQQINMSFDEFDYICNLYHPSEHTQLLNQISNIHSISGVGELETIYKKCESYLKTHWDISIQKLHQSLTVILQIRKNGISNRDKVTQDIIDILWNDLKHHDTWYASDFNILNSILFVLPTETILDTTQLVLHRLEKYSDFYQICLPFIFITNIFRCAVISVRLLLKQQNYLNDMMQLHFIRPESEFVMLMKS